MKFTISTDRTDYVATNDLSQSSTDVAQKVCKIRWKIEEFHREIKQSIRVEQVREVIEFLSTSAVKAKQKMVIIHEADMLNPTAANKLLKTLEEPIS